MQLNGSLIVSQPLTEPLAVCGAAEVILARYAEHNIIITPWPPITNIFSHYGIPFSDFKYSQFLSHINIPHRCHHSPCPLVIQCSISERKVEIKMMTNWREGIEKKYTIKVIDHISLQPLSKMLLFWPRKFYGETLYFLV